MAKQSQLDKVIAAYEAKVDVMARDLELTRELLDALRRGKGVLTPPDDGESAAQRPRDGYAWTTLTTETKTRRPRRPRAAKAPDVPGSQG